MLFQALAKCRQVSLLIRPINIRMCIQKQRYSSFKPFQPKSNEKRIAEVGSKDKSSPKSLHNRLNIPDSYQLIYVYPMARLHLASIALVHLLFIPALVVVNCIIFTEFIGYSRFHEVTDRIYFYLGFVNVWLAVMLFTTYVHSRQTILRIYNNKNKYLAVTMDSLFRPKTVKFEAKTVGYRQDPQQVPVKGITNKILGNFYINNRLYHFETTKFISNEALRNMLGDRVYQMATEKRSGFLY